MKIPISRSPPSGVPAGTVWFGGPVDRFKITLRIFGDQLDPDHITSLLCCTPTVAEAKGKPVVSATGTILIPRKGRWFFTIESKDCHAGDVEDGIRTMLGRLPDDLDLWASLTTTYSVDVSCGLFLAASNRGFELSKEVSKMLSDRQLVVGFDVYFDDAVAAISNKGMG